MSKDNKAPAPPAPIEEAVSVLREGEGWQLKRYTIQGDRVLKVVKEHGPDVRWICEGKAHVILGGEG